MTETHHATRLVNGYYQLKAAEEAWKRAVAALWEQIPTELLATLVNDLVPFWVAASPNEFMLKLLEASTQSKSLTVEYPDPRWFQHSMLGMEPSLPVAELVAPLEQLQQIWAGSVEVSLDQTGLPRRLTVIYRLVQSPPQP